MSDKAETDRADRELWRRFATEAPAPAGRPTIDASDLAAWLDGQADAATTGRVEAALSADPALLDEVTALRETPSVPTVPESVLLAAKALAGRGEPVVHDHVIRSPWWQRLQWAAAAAAVVVACLGGFTFGQGMSLAERQADRGVARASSAVMSLVSDSDLTVPDAPENGSGGTR